MSEQRSECEARTVDEHPQEDGTVMIVVNGWCRVGSTVYADFYVDDRETPQKVTKLYRHPGTLFVNVDTDGGGVPRAVLRGVNFKQFIKRPSQKSSE